MIDEYLQSTERFETILDYLRWGISKAKAAPLFYGHGTDNVWDDVRSLILGCLQLPWDLDDAFLQARLTEDEKLLLCRQLVRRIHEHVPVPYLTHQAYFCGLHFYVDERVLIPRSPIAECIEASFNPWIEGDGVTRILDLCTGSGCIAIACCFAFPDALIDAIDVSADALAVAGINRTKHQVESQLTLIQSDCFDALHESVRYDVIVSNPPYVGQDEMQTLPSEYHHEPTLALEAASDGLAIVDRILKQAPAYLSAHGILVVEVGNSQVILMDKYPDMPFVWLDFERGGQGVFVLTALQLNEYWSNRA